MENTNGTDRCVCRRSYLQRGIVPPPVIYVHLAWCPESYNCIEYDALPWWKKLFKLDPRKLGKFI